MRVLLFKTGIRPVWRPKNPLADQGHLRGIVEGLLRHGHDVRLMSFLPADECPLQCVPREGETRGTLTFTHWTQRFLTNTGYSDLQEMRRMWDWLEAEAREFRPDVALEHMGPAFSSWDPLDMARVCMKDTLNYTTHPLKVISRLGLPRLMIVTDVRLFAHEHGMVESGLVPAAVIGCGYEGQKKIYQHRFKVMMRHSKFCTWPNYDAEAMPTRGDKVMIFGHAHVKDKRLNVKSRLNAWQNVANWIPFEEVWGVGWAESELNAFIEKYKGVIDPGDIDLVLRNALCSPVVPMHNNQVTPKCHQLALNGAVPLLYTSDGFSYDGHNVLFSSDHPLRFRNENEAAALIDACRRPDWREFALNEVLQLYKPDWSKLHEMVEHFGNGGGVDFERFGGYERL